MKDYFYSNFGSGLCFKTENIWRAVCAERMVFLLKDL